MICTFESGSVVVTAEIYSEETLLLCTEEGVCECNNTVTCDVEYVLFGADENGCDGQCVCNNTIICGDDYILSGADDNECGGQCVCNNTIICGDDYILSGADDNDCGGQCVCENTVHCDMDYVLSGADDNDCGGQCVCNNTVTCDVDYILWRADRNGCGGQCVCNNTIICGADYILSGADDNDCGGQCVCDNTITCGIDYLLFGVDNNHCGGQCVCNNWVVCDVGYTLSDADETGCGGVCMVTEQECEDQCELGFVLIGTDVNGCNGTCVENCRMTSCSCSGLSCTVDESLCTTQCFDQASQSECDGLSQFEIATGESSGGDGASVEVMNVACSWCESVECSSGYNLVSTDVDGCGGLCVISDPCTAWNGMDTSFSGVISLSGTSEDDDICEEYAENCESSLYVDFSNTCVFTPPCPAGMLVDTDLLGTDICVNNATCTDESCMEEEVCIEHYGFHSCMTTSTDTESCDGFGLCGPNFVDDEIDGFLDTFSLDAVDEQYQLSECFVDASQNWHLSLQVPVYDQNGTSPGLYLEQHSSDGVFSNTNMNMDCYIDLMGVLELDSGTSVISEYQVNSAVFIHSLGTYDAPISEDVFATIEYWDSNSVSGWLRASMSISIPHLYDQCGWESDTEDGILHTELTARYLEGVNDVHVAKTCVFTIITEEDVSYEERTGMSISFNYWLSQYEPEVEAVGLPNIFYQDGEAGMEIAVSLTYNYVPSQMSIGPFDDEVADFAQFFHFDEDSINCYNPHIADIYADWRATSGFLDENGEPTYCVDTRCRVIIYIRTDVVEVPTYGVDFSECLADNSDIDVARLSFTVKSQQCDGRGDDIVNCEFSALQQIRSDLGEYISLSLSGLANTQVLTYQFAAVTAHTKSLTKKQLERTSCVQLTQVSDEPWVSLTTGLNDPQVCYDITGVECPGEYCITEESDNICLYAYVKENELIDSVYNGSQTQIMYDTIVIRPLSLSGSALPSFSFDEVDDSIYPDNTVLDSEMFALHVTGMNMMPRELYEYASESSPIWDSERDMPGVDGICWNPAELVRFYATLQGSSFEPFKLMQVDFTVRYAFADSGDVGSRRLLGTEGSVVDEDSVTVEMDVEYSYLEILQYSNNVTDEGWVSSTDTDRLELQFVFLMAGLLVIISLRIVNDR